MNSYLTDDENEKAVDQGMKGSEKEENTDSKQSIIEEIPAMTAEPHEDNTQIIQNIPTFQSFTSVLKVGNKIIEFTSFNLFSAFIALDRSLMLPCLSLVLRSISSTAKSGLDPCTTQLI